MTRVCSTPWCRVRRGVRLRCPAAATPTLSDLSCRTLLAAGAVRFELSDAALAVAWREVRCVGWRSPPRPSLVRPQIGRDYPLNLSISVSGGKETN